MNITSLTQRYSRHALTEPNPTYYLWRFVANGVRSARAALSRPLHPDTDGIARELTEQGIVVGSTDRFLAADGQQALRESAARILETSRSDALESIIRGATSEPDRQKDFLIHLVSYPQGMAADDPLLRVALDRKLLDIVSCYLGLWPLLYSVGAWLNYPTDAPPEQSQLWHRDPEDLRLIKVFIYLVDVDEQCGPFTYIPRTHPFGEEASVSPRLERKKRMGDDRMTRFIPPEKWRVCTGPANTMIIADTIGYHRGGKPIAGRRILITFTYTSGAPITSRQLWVRGTPSWSLAGIQRAALRPLLRRPGEANSDKKQKTR